MRYSILTISALFFLFGCAPPEIFYKQGVTNAQLDEDYLACQTQAAREVPPNIQTRYIPPVYRYESVCSGSNCYTRPILVQPARWEQYDANDGLRRAASQQCMSAKDYDRISLPRCEEAVLKSSQVAINTPAPALNNQSCAVKTKTGGWRILTP